MHLRRSIPVISVVELALTADVNISIEALQDSQTGWGVYLHENCGHSETDEEDYQQDRDWWVDVFDEFGDIGDDQVAKESICNADCHPAKELDECADTVCDEESGSVLERKHECSHGRSAEVLTGEGDLAVRVLIEELDESVEAIKAAPDAVRNGSHDCVVLLCALHLFVNVFEDDSDNPDHRQNERTKSQWAKIISESPPEPCWEAEAATAVLVGCEIPSAHPNNESESKHGLNEFKSPEESEDMSVSHPLLVITQLDFLQLAPMFRLSDLTRAQKVSEAGYPEGGPRQK